MNEQPRFTALGKLVSILLVAGLVALGVYMIRGRFGGAGRTAPGAERRRRRAAARPKCRRSRSKSRSCRRRRAFQFKDNIVPIEISEYAGYAGLIAANGGLEPTENSLFFKNHGFKVKLTISEDETWSELNEGKIAASVTTVDVLAAYGRQLHAVVPAQIGFSRGADGVVVRSDIKRINQLKGKIDRVGAVHRGRLLHPLPRAGSRPADQPARQPRRDAAPRSPERGLHRGRLRGRRPVPERREVGQEPARRLRDVGAEGLGGGRAAAADRRTS